MDPQAIYDVNEFVSSSDRFVEMLHYITCSAMDPLQWTGAVRTTLYNASKSFAYVTKFDSGRLHDD